MLLSVLEEADCPEWRLGALHALFQLVGAISTVTPCFFLFLVSTKRIQGLVANAMAHFERTPLSLGQGGSSALTVLEIGVAVAWKPLLREQGS